MRVVIQRVLRSRVTVEGKEIACTGPGLVCLTGLRACDEEADLRWIANKLLNLRLWPSVEQGTKPKSWARNVQQLNYDILLVSQFTLYATAKRGNKPDFHGAMAPADARQMYAEFVAIMREAYGETKVKDGAFGEMMQVELVNDGPVTIELSTDELKLSGLKGKRMPKIQLESSKEVGKEIGKEKGVARAGEERVSKSDREKEVASQ